MNDKMRYILEWLAQMFFMDYVLPLSLSLLLYASGLFLFLLLLFRVFFSPFEKPSGILFHFTPFSIQLSGLRHILHAAEPTHTLHITHL